RFVAPHRTTRRFPAPQPAGKESLVLARCRRDRGRRSFARRSGRAVLRRCRCVSGKRERIEMAHARPDQHPHLQPQLRYAATWYLLALGTLLAAAIVVRYER